MVEIKFAKFHAKKILYICGEPPKGPFEIAQSERVRFW